MRIASPARAMVGPPSLTTISSPAWTKSPSSKVRVQSANSATCANRMYPPPSCVVPALVIARASSRPGTSSLKGTSRSVSSFTFVCTATASSLSRAYDQLSVRSIEHQRLNAARGGRTDLVEIGIAQQHLELFSNMCRVARADDHTPQGGRSAGVLSRRLTGVEAVGDIPLDHKRERDPRRAGIHILGAPMQNLSVRTSPRTLPRRR